jgi:hypothetical protein
MSDSRPDRSEKFKHKPDERGNPHGGHGRSAEHDVAEEFETATGHPPGDGSSGTPSDKMPLDMPGDTDLQHDQHARKGQAQSPRELNLNQPEKKREGHH